ncbi:MAG: hypothetical protein OXH15_09970 [Gammaproteobacteria bacterium]|nr:hypothetical protein [Gammaproteobacteria bacterium]
MTDLALQLGGHLFVLLVAAIAWGLDNKWRDRRTRNRRKWTHILLAAIVLATVINGATTWRGHNQQQAHQQRLARIDQGVNQLVRLGRERNPGLTEREALEGVVAEVHTLRERTTALESDLRGVERYAAVAELNVLGLKGLGGAGIKETSPLSRLLQDAYTVVSNGQTTYHARCDQTGIAALERSAEFNPDFPFAHWALASCARQNNNPNWQTHAQRAVEILKHTTRIAGHRPEHQEALQQLTDWLTKAGF